MPSELRNEPPLHSRLLWFVVLWAGGVLCVAVIGVAIRAFLTLGSW